MTLLRPRVGEWTEEQTRALLAAARSAPTRSHEHPWLIELRGHGAFVYERLSMRRRYPAGRDRLLSCGAVVANLHTTIRALGWEPELLTGPCREPDLIAVVRAGRRHVATGAALARREAIAHVDRSDRVPLLSPVDGQTGRWLADADWCPRTEAKLLADPKTAAVLGELVLHAARRWDGDRRIANELAAWLGATPMTDDHCVVPYERAVSAIAARIAAERVLVVLTPDDGRTDQMMAGAAVQAIRLTATMSELAAVPVTALLRIPELRSGLIDAAQLPGFPQALVRIGRVPVPVRQARQGTHRGIRPLPVDWW